MKWETLLSLGLPLGHKVVVVFFCISEMAKVEWILVLRVSSVIIVLFGNMLCLIHIFLGVCCSKSPKYLGF